MERNTVPALWRGRVHVTTIDAELALRLRIIRQLVAKLAHNDAESFTLSVQTCAICSHLEGAGIAIGVI